MFSKIKTVSHFHAHTVWVRVSGGAALGPQCEPGSRSNRADRPRTNRANKTRQGHRAAWRQSFGEQSSSCLWPSMGTHTHTEGKERLRTRGGRWRFSMRYTAAQAGRTQTRKQQVPLTEQTTSGPEVTHQEPKQGSSEGQPSLCTSSPSCVAATSDSRPAVGKPFD